MRRLREGGKIKIKEEQQNKSWQGKLSSVGQRPDPLWSAQVGVSA